MKITIKPMETEDEINGKGYVHYKSWHETYTGLVDGNYMSGITEEKCKNIAHRWPDNLLVAKDGGRVVGFAGCGAYRDNTLPDCGEVYAIYVLAQYHGMKVGYELMKSACERLKDYPKTALWVLEGNERAIRFYERFGFRFDGCEQEINLGTPKVELRMICDNPYYVNG